LVAGSILFLLYPDQQTLDAFVILILLVGAVALGGSFPTVVHALANELQELRSSRYSDKRSSEVITTSMGLQETRSATEAADQQQYSPAS
jgi:hypothetical protein